MAYHGSLQYVAGYHSVFGETCRQQGQHSARNCKTPWNRGAGTRFFPTRKKIFEFWRSAKTVEQFAWWMVKIWIMIWIHHTARVQRYRFQRTVKISLTHFHPSSMFGRENQNPPVSTVSWILRPNLGPRFFRSKKTWSCAAEFTTSLAPMTSTTSKFSMSGFTSWTNSNALQQSSTGARKHGDLRDPSECSMHWTLA